MPELDGTGSRLAPSTRVALALALLALVVAVLPGVFAGGALYLRDINMVWLPQVESLVRGVAAGSWPLWDPYSGFGRPLLADPRAEVLYPPTWLNLVMRPATFYAVFAAGHLVLAGVGMWRLARREGLGAAGAAAAAGTWVGCGPLLSLVSMWHHLAAAAWVPWVVAAFDALAERPAPRAIVGAAAALAIQVLAGSPDVTALTLLIVAVRFAGTMVGDRERRWPSVGAVMAAGALAVLASAAQWLPTLDVVRRSTRWNAGGSQGGTWALHPLGLVEILVPARWADMPLTPDAVLAVLEAKEPWMRSLYLGAVAAGLVVAGLTASRRGRGPLFVLLLLGGVLALGHHAPVYPVLSLLPGAGALRFPVKAFLVAAFAWSLLAGRGVHALAEGSRRARIAASVTAGASCAVLFAAGMSLASTGPGHGALAALVHTAPPAWVRAPVIAAGLLTVAAAALAAMPARRIGPGGAAAALALLAVADLAWRHRDLNPTAPRALFEYRPEALHALHTANGARTYVYDYSMDPGVGPRRAFPYLLARQPEGWTTSAAGVLGVQAYLNPPTAARWGVLGSYDLDILGFDTLAADRMSRFLRQVEDSSAHVRLLQAGAVANVLALEPAAWWRDLVPAGEVAGFFHRPIRIFRVPDPVPLAYVVDGVRVADDEPALSMLAGDGFDPRSEVILDRGVPRPPGPDAAGTATLARLGWDTIEVSVDAKRDGYLVLVGAYDPGWGATVDGRATPVSRANVAFRAVPVAAGRHAVTLRYRPAAVPAGLGISALGLLVGLLLWRRRGLPFPPAAAVTEAPQ